MQEEKIFKEVEKFRIHLDVQLKNALSKCFLKVFPETISFIEATWNNVLGGCEKGTNILKKCDVPYPHRV